MKKYIALTAVFILASCGSSTSTNASNPPPPDTQVRKNGEYKVFIETQKANVYIINMPNGNTCYVAEQKMDDYYQSKSLSSPSISCVK